MASRKRKVDLRKLKNKIELPWASARSKINCWRNRDRRKAGYGTAKFAVDRDGILYLVECPRCHHQDVWYHKKYATFRCHRCDAWFQVYLEDGLWRIIDWRRGDINVPYDTRGGWYLDRKVEAVKEPGADGLQLGITADAPWWWDRRTLYRDLQKSGYDAHGHEKYKVVPQPADYKQPEAVAEVAVS